MNKIKLSIWMCHLNFNMFKWGSPMNIIWDNPFGYPNHTLTQHWKENRHSRTLIFEEISHPTLPFSMLQTFANLNVTQEEATEIVVGMEKSYQNDQEVVGNIKQQWKCKSLPTRHITTEVFFFLMEA